MADIQKVRDAIERIREIKEMRRSLAELEPAIAANTLLISFNHRDAYGDDTTYDVAVSEESQQMLTLAILKDSLTEEHKRLRSVVSAWMSSESLSD